MNQVKCGSCNSINSSDMTFCTSCGKQIGFAPQSSIPTVQNVVVEPQKFQIQQPVAKKSSSSKYWVGGLLGCFGLMILAVVGIVLAVSFSISKSPNNTANSAQNANKPDLSANKKTSETKSSGNSKTESVANQSDDYENDVIRVFQDRKEAGNFKQLTANVVKVDEFFPYAKAAAQGSYHNGSKYVSVAIGKFENFEDAKKNFDEQFSRVKKKGGMTRILETSVDGTINGVYQTKGNFTTEYCTKSAFCYRLVSKDALALKYFIEHFITL